MGVKSLWNLLAPVGRPVMLEVIEGKALAIDSSIWIYQFQATMRDKDGRALANAHVLGFLRRICKLLFYGIKPVFVFDGGAPVLKRTTITERKKKKASATASHAKLAEKLLAAQMRREALNQTSTHQPSKSSKGKGKATAGPVLIDDDTVYLEDIDPSMPKTPAKKAKEAKEKDPSSSSSKKKKDRFHDHDPYRLPDVDLEEAVANATRSAIPDPRIATEDELRAFIEEMKPEDFDVTSPAFQELPTEVQYEIIGDLRLKSRQTSYKRLQNMLNNAPTPLDFSREQIKNLKQRNALTQQLLTTTDSIGKAHISIPVRIASERNKEYLLIKNEGEGGGWILGVKDEGTAAKPIQIDQDPSSSENDSDEEMEEVAIPRTAALDPDLREYQREMALSAIEKRYTPKHLAPLTTKPIQKPSKSTPLFEPDEEEDVPVVHESVESDEDAELALAIQRSLDQEANVSRATVSSLPEASTSRLVTSDADSDDFYAPYTPPEVSKAGPSTVHSLGPSTTSSSAIGGTSRLTSSQPSRHPSLDQVTSEPADVIDMSTQSESIDIPRPLPTPEADTDSDDMEEVPCEQPPLSQTDSSVIPDYKQNTFPSSSNDAIHLPSDTFALGSNTLTDHESGSIPARSAHQLEDAYDNLADESISFIYTRTNSERGLESDGYANPSRTPSPTLGEFTDSQQHPPNSTENWDAAQEMDPEAEEGEFARFISQVKGKDLDDVRQEIDEEIKSLNQQKKAAMRDSDDITQQMISQIMMLLRLFGIPYITAPMEAEAQCATLLSLGLVDGIITDDSDVFLFGGLRVFKNMFNQSKTVECFSLNELTRDLGLDRETLIRLAYLLGSDYVDGVPGVGPVVAMELLREFPGAEGLHDFRDWWSKVQTGKDTEEESASKFRKSFKRKFKDLYLSDDWPNPAVSDAYLHPTVDESDEPFKWGLPDLDALRDFLGDELGWPQNKVDDLLLPIIQKIGKRNQKGAMNKQGNLNEFFDVTSGNGVYAPRKRQAYTSKRLQKVVSDFRAGQSKGKSQAGSPGLGQNEGLDSGSDVDGGSGKRNAKTRKRKRKKTEQTGKARTKTSKGNKRSRGDGDTPAGDDSDSGDEYDEGRDAVTESLGVRLRPRPTPAYKQSLTNE